MFSESRMAYYPQFLSIASSTRNEGCSFQSQVAASLHLTIAEALLILSTAEQVLNFDEILIVPMMSVCMRHCVWFLLSIGVK